MPAPKEVLKGDASVSSTGTLRRLNGTPIVDVDLERLIALNNEAVAEFVKRGVRLEGTGLVKGVATNMMSFYYDDKYMTCGDQTVAMLEMIAKKYGGKVGAQNGITTVWTQDGWMYQVGTSWPNHAFVLARSPKGYKFRVDPWYGEVWRLPSDPYPVVLGSRG